MSHQQIFQLNRDGSSWVDPDSLDKCVLFKDHNAVTPVRLEPGPLGLESSTTTEPLCSLSGFVVFASMIKSSLKCICIYAADVKSR